MTDIARAVLNLGRFVADNLAGMHSRPCVPEGRSQCVGVEFKAYGSRREQKNFALGKYCEDTREVRCPQIAIQAKVNMLANPNFRPVQSALAGFPRA